MLSPIVCHKVLRGLLPLSFSPTGDSLKCSRHKNTVCSIISTDLICSGLVSILTFPGPIFQKDFLHPKLYTFVIINFPVSSPQRPTLTGCITTFSTSAIGTQAKQKSTAFPLPVYLPSGFLKCRNHAWGNPQARKHCFASKLPAQTSTLPKKSMWAPTGAELSYCGCRTKSTGGRQPGRKGWIHD